MTQAVAHILDEAERLTPEERAELTDRLVERLAQNIPPDIEEAQRKVVRRRVAEVESGEVALIPGDEAFSQIRRMVDEARRAR